STMIFSTDEKTRKYGDILNDFFEALNKMFYKILDGILLYATIGVFAISASKFGSQGWETLKSLLAFTGVFYIGLLIIWSIVYTSFLSLYENAVIDYFKNMK